MSDHSFPLSRIRPRQRRVKRRRTSRYLAFRRRQERILRTSRTVGEYWLRIERAAHLLRTPR